MRGGRARAGEEWTTSDKCIIFRQQINTFFCVFYHVRCEHEGSPVPLESAKHLGVTEELSEVDVEQVAAVLHHYIVVVPVADAQDVRDDAVSRARP